MIVVVILALLGMVCWTESSNHVRWVDREVWMRRAGVLLGAAMLLGLLNIFLHRV